jgi:rhodanese-related sulfurtransferase
MDQILEFVANHGLLSGAFVAVLALLTWTEMTRRSRGFKELTPAEAVNFMNQEGAVVFDISPSADFRKAHILGARNLKAARLKELDKDVAKLITRPILVACKSGQTATQAASELIKHGAQEVAVLKGGMSQWVADHYPVTSR